MTKDPRHAQLAQVLVGHSTQVQPGDQVLIETFDTPDAMTQALVERVIARGGTPWVRNHRTAVLRQLYQVASEAQLKAWGKQELERMTPMDAYIAVRGAENIFEYADIPAERMRLVARYMRPSLERRVNHTRWVVTRWPTPSMAQQAQMSTAAFEDFFFRVCTLDYSRMVAGQKALMALMERTDQVHIQGPGTDLRFSIQGIPAVMCDGRRNIPDGETFTAPVKNSVEGVISYNTPTVYQGVSFDNVRLVFKKGKVIDASASQNTQRLQSILDSDAGARYVGEFALGFNPHILHPVRDILFDEKIAGSFHFTPGAAYASADNGNRSQVHWDLVCIQRPEYGGGTVHFDGKLIRKDGLFVPKALAKLNPEHLLGI
jgi:aminopeptidase